LRHTRGAEGRTWPTCPIPIWKPPLSCLASTTNGRGDTRARLQSAIVLLLMAGLLLALPFVLSIGAVVFLPPVTGARLHDHSGPACRSAEPHRPARHAGLAPGHPHHDGGIVAALALILQPAFAMVDQVPDMLATVSRRFAEWRGNLAWINDFNRQLARLMGHSPREVVLASPSVIEQVAFATPSVVLEALVTLLMTFFMIETRLRVQRRLAQDGSSVNASVRIARVMRDVQDRVAGYLLTVALINLGVGVIVAGGLGLSGSARRSCGAGLPSCSISCPISARSR